MKKEPETLTLNIFRGGNCIRTSVFNCPVIKIGKLKSGNVCIDGDDNVARMHAVIEVSDSGVLLIDLGSVHGTVLNGVAVTGSAPIFSGDILTFGSYRIEVTFGKPALAGTNQEIPEDSIVLPNITNPATLDLLASGVELDAMGSVSVSFKAGRKLREGRIDVQTAMTRLVEKIEALGFKFTGERKQ